MSKKTWQYSASGSAIMGCKHGIRSQSEVAAMLGISKSLVRYIEGRALSKLRIRLRQSMMQEPEFFFLER